uniref:Uncharacterized protein n=1 Tax=viral metagenome TaxID=1070528 RepID=A0A6C0EFV0_9ZZZZ
MNPTYNFHQMHLRLVLNRYSLEMIVYFDSIFVPSYQYIGI